MKGCNIPSARLLYTNIKAAVLHALILTFSLLSLIGANAQVKGMQKFRFASTHTSFPDTGRKNGYLRDTVSYDAATHYSDSSVLVIVPPGFSAKDKVDLVFWFHGWMNNIDSADVQFELSRQFIASGRKAVLVLAETAKNAPDSYGGKLEQPGVFSLLVKDVLDQLGQRRIVRPEAGAATITLAGHSGGYSVIAKILQDGATPVQEVILFDALYARQSMFMNWIKESPGNTFINIFTDHGGTAQNSVEFIEQLKKENISFLMVEEIALTSNAIKANRILFVHTQHGHNEIIRNPDNFQLFLSNTK